MNDILDQLAPIAGLFGLIGFAGLAGLKHPIQKGRAGLGIRMMGLLGLVGLAEPPKPQACALGQAGLDLPVWRALSGARDDGLARDPADGAEANMVGAQIIFHPLA